MRNFFIFTFVIVVVMVLVSTWVSFNVYPVELMTLRENVRPGMTVDEVHSLVPDYDPKITDNGNTPGGEPLLYEFYLERGHGVRVVYKNGRAFRLLYKDREMVEYVTIFKP